MHCVFRNLYKILVNFPSKLKMKTFKAVDFALQPMLDPIIKTRQM